MIHKRVNYSAKFPATYEGSANMEKKQSLKEKIEPEDDENNDKKKMES